MKYLSNLKLLYFGALFLGINITAFAQLKGNVFLDKNNNGVKDASDEGIYNAVVSDGYNVVRTDIYGGYNLPGWKKQRFITIYPSGDFKTTKR